MPNSYDDGRITMELSQRTFVLGSWNDTINGFWGININLLGTTGFSEKLFTYRYLNYSNLSANILVKKNEAAMYSFGVALRPNDSIIGADLHIGKYNLNVDTVFTKVYHDSGQVFVCDAINLNALSFAVLGRYNRSFSEFDSTQICLFKIDSSGTLIERHNLAKNTLYPLKIFHASAQNEYIILGENKHPLGNSFYITNFCMVLNDVTYAQKYYSDNITGQVNDFLYNTTFVNGAIYASLSSDANAPPYGAVKKVKLLKLRRTAVGMYKNFNQVGPFDPSPDLMATDIKVDGQNVIVSVEHSGTKGAAFFYCDTNLYYRCFTSVATQESNFFSRIASFYCDSQNNIVGTGFCSSLTEPKLYQWNFKTEDYKTYPRVYCELSGIEKSLQDFFAVGPNPCEEFINIGDPHFMLERLSILNINGQEIYSQKCEKANSYQVVVSKLQVGVYIIILQTNAGPVARRFLKN